MVCNEPECDNSPESPVDIVEGLAPVLEVLTGRGRRLIEGQPATRAAARRTRLILRQPCFPGEH